MKRFLFLFCVLANLFISCNKNRDLAEGDSLIVYRSEDGRILTREDLRKETGRVSYEILSERNVPKTAERIHNKGRAAGSKGNYEQAIELLKQAAKIAPNWPYPVYDLAFTYLLMNDYENARTYYNKTVELSPRGFFKAITASWALNHEKEGKIPQGTYLRYLSVEWKQSTEEKLLELKKITEEIPIFAPAWLDLAGLLEDSEQKKSAIESGLSLQSDNETKGLLLLSKAIFLNNNGQKDKSIEILGELILDSNSTILVSKLAKETLWLFSEEDNK